MKRWQKIVAVAAVAAFAMGGCAMLNPSWESRTEDVDFYETDRKLKDGTVIRCLFWLDHDDFDANGMDCNWSGDND